MNTSEAVDTKTLSFVFHGGRACLDFANTLRRRKDPLHPTVDLLQEPSDLDKWFTACQRKTSWADNLPALKENQAPITPTEISNLRQAIINIAEIKLGIHPSLESESIQTSLDILNNWAIHQPQKHLDNLAPPNSFSLTPNLTHTQLLGALAQDAITLLGTANAKRLKECAHERCGILFEDRSQGLKRQWCSMKECGNRMKAHRHNKGPLPPRFPEARGTQQPKANP